MENLDTLIALARDRQAEACDRAAAHRLRRSVRQQERHRPLDLPRLGRTWQAAPLSHLSRIGQVLRAWRVTGVPRRREERHDA